MKTAYLLASSLMLGLSLQAQDKELKRINASEAVNHYQEDCVVTGRVAQVTLREKVCYLNLDKPYPNSPLTGVIFSSNTNKFGDLGRLQAADVEISGPIDDRNGQLQIVLKEAGQLKVVSTKDISTTNKANAWQAAKYGGQTLIVTGTIAQVSLREKVVNLNFEKPFPDSPFSGVIFARSTNQFGDLTAWQGKEVELRGTIEVFKNKPQIIINSTNQLRVMTRTTK